MSLHDQEPVKFIIKWKGELEGSSEVMAHTKEEAESIAYDGQDENFEFDDPEGNWKIDKIEEVKK